MDFLNWLKKLVGDDHPDAGAPFASRRRPAPLDRSESYSTKPNENRPQAVVVPDRCEAEQATTLTPEEVASIKAAIAKEVSERPPTIGVVGVSGVGKSSTINTLFKTELPISDTVACTKEFTATDLGVVLNSGHAKNLSVALRIVDAPGLGEDLERDPSYLNMYREHLPQCDAVLWIIAARNRAVALDQYYLEKLQDLHENMIFGVNQVDLVEPLNWNSKINLPSKEQLVKIDQIVADRSAKLTRVLGKKLPIVAYSAKAKYNLEDLFGTILESCSARRRWIFDGLKGFKYTDFLPAELREQFL